MFALDLREAVILITGGASGIGAACARAFVAEGATVALLDRDEVAGNALKASLGEAALFVAADVSDEAEVVQAVARVAAWRGHLDALVCCAGVSGPVGTPITATAAEDWIRVLNINLGGLFNAAKHAIPWLEAGRLRSVVILASDSSFLAYPGMAPYSTSKGGALMFTRSLAVDHPALRVNCICPSVVDTPMSRHDLGMTEAQMRTSQFPVIQSTQLANHVLFLTSRVSAPINATSVVVDFGYMARPSFPQPEFSQDA